MIILIMNVLLVWHKVKWQKFQVTFGSCFGGHVKRHLLVSLVSNGTELSFLMTHLNMWAHQTHDKGLIKPIWVYGLFDMDLVSMQLHSQVTFMSNWKWTWYFTYHVSHGVKFSLPMNVFEHVNPSIDKVPINLIWVDKWFSHGL
jgi:hypothetical protein